MDRQSPDLSDVASRGIDAPAPSDGRGELIRRVGGRVELRVDASANGFRPATIVSIDVRALRSDEEFAVLTVTMQGDDVEEVRHLVPTPLREQLRAVPDVRVVEVDGDVLREWDQRYRPLERPVLCAAVVRPRDQDVRDATDELLVQLGDRLELSDEAQTTLQSMVHRQLDRPEVLESKPNFVRKSEISHRYDKLRDAFQSVTSPQIGVEVRDAGVYRSGLRSSRPMAEFEVATPHSRHRVVVALADDVHDESLADAIGRMASLYVRHPWVVPVDLEIGGRHLLARSRSSTVGRFEESRRMVHVRIDRFTHDARRQAEALANLPEADGERPIDDDPTSTLDHEMGHVVAASYGALFDLVPILEGRESTRDGDAPALRSMTSWMGAARLGVSVMNALEVPTDVGRRAVAVSASLGMAMESGVLEPHLGAWGPYVRYAMGSYAMTDVRELVAEALSYAALPQIAVDYRLRDRFDDAFAPLDRVVAEQPELLPALRDVIDGRLVR